MTAVLDQHVHEKCGYSLLKDKGLEQSRLVPNGKAIELQKHGKGKSHKELMYLLRIEEEQILWGTVLGTQIQRA